MSKLITPRFRNIYLQIDSLPVELDYKFAICVYPGALDFKSEVLRFSYFLFVGPKLLQENVKPFLAVLKKIIQVEGATFSNFEMKVKWSVCFLFLGYCDDIIDNIVKQYAENTTELLEKSISLKTNATPPLNSSFG